MFDINDLTFHKSDLLFHPRFWITNAADEIILDTRYWYGSAVTSGYIGASAPDYELYDLLSLLAESGNTTSWREYLCSLKWRKNLKNVLLP